MIGGGGGVWAQRLSSLRLRLADATEAIFGPDPGLLRLTVATRTLASAAITLTALLLLYGSAGLAAAAPIGLGFMTSNFANMSVRDPEPAQQAVTLVLLAVPALAGVAVASMLSRWPLVADGGFVVVVAAAALARLAGPRWMAVGMVAFIAYFIGDIIRPPLSAAPELTIAVALALAASALARFVLLPDRPASALREIRRHIQRRIDHILGEVEELLAAPAAPLDETRLHRLHLELGRLDDAVLIAADQIAAVWRLGESEPQPLSEALFVLQLAAERLVWATVRHLQEPRSTRLKRRVLVLRHRLSRAAALGEPAIAVAPKRRAGTDGAPGVALAELEAALVGLAAAWPVLDARSARGGRT